MEDNQNIAKMLFVFFAITHVLIENCSRNCRHTPEISDCYLGYSSIGLLGDYWSQHLQLQKLHCYLWQNLHKYTIPQFPPSISLPLFCNIQHVGTYFSTWVRNYSFWNESYSSTKYYKIFLLYYYIYFVIKHRWQI